MYIIPTLVTGTASEQIIWELQKPMNSFYFAGQLFLNVTVIFSCPLFSDIHSDFLSLVASQNHKSHTFTPSTI